MSPTTLADIIRAESERQLSADEADAWLAAPVSPYEREEVLALAKWFTGRYPTPADRLAYVRRATARWRRAAFR